MQHRPFSAPPFILIGMLFLLLFGIITWGVLFDSAWITSLDLALMDWIQSFVTESRTEFIMKATELGDIKLIILLTVICVLFLFFSGRFADGLWLGGTMLLCGVVLTYALKVAVDRDRPDILPLITKTTGSFPSGHSVGTSIFFGLVALVVIFSSLKIWKKWVLGLLVLSVILFILVTRVYLGVHFPTDVIGGFFFGMASLWISIGIYQLLRNPLRRLLQKMKLKDRSTGFTKKSFF